jgi:hypothetical protein
MRIANFERAVFLKKQIDELERQRQMWENSNSCKVHMQSRVNGSPVTFHPEEGFINFPALKKQVLNTIDALITSSKAEFAEL